MDTQQKHQAFSAFLTALQQSSEVSPEVLARGRALWEQILAEISGEFPVPTSSGALDGVLEMSWDAQTFYLSIDIGPDAVDWMTLNRETKKVLGEVHQPGEFAQQFKDELHRLHVHFIHHEMMLEGLEKPDPSTQS